MTHMAMEVLPKAQIFAQGSIATAGHVTENAIKLEVLPLATLLHVGEFPRIVVRDKQGGQVEFSCLMG